MKISILTTITLSLYFFLIPSLKATHTEYKTRNTTVVLETDNRFEELSPTVNPDRINTDDHLLVTHYDCKYPKNLEAYSLTKIGECNVKNDDVVSKDAHILLWQKEIARRIPGYRCEVKYTMTRWFCNKIQSYSEIDGSQNDMYKDLRLSADLCKQAVTNPKNANGITTISYIKWDKDHLIRFKEGETIETTNTVGKALDNNNHDCTGQGWITKFSFRADLVATEFVYNMENGEISENGDVLPCKFSEGGCKTVYPTGRAYYWNKDLGCTNNLIAFLQVKMVRWIDTNRYFLIHERDNNLGSNKFDNHPSFKLEVFNTVEPMCSKTTENITKYLPNSALVGTEVQALKTQYDNIFITLLIGGFDMKTGQPDKLYEAIRYEYCHRQEIKTCSFISLEDLGNFIKDRNYYTGVYQDLSYSVLQHADRESMTNILSMATLYELTQNAQIFHNSIDKDYIVSLRTNQASQLDFLYHKISTVQTSQIANLVNTFCKLEQQQKLLILQTAQIDSAIAGYLLTGKRNFFLDVMNGQGWLYSCTKAFSPWIKQDKCYDAIPIVYQGVTQFVDPISRKIRDTHDILEINCTDTANKMRFQLDPDDETTWYSFTPDIRPRSPLKIFQPFLSFLANGQKILTSLGAEYESLNTGVYNKEDLDKLYSDIQLGKRSTSFLKTMVDKADVEITGLINYKGDWYWSPEMEKKVQFDNLLSPEYFSKNFLTHITGFLGTFYTCLIEFGGLYGCFLFATLIGKIFGSIGFAQSFIGFRKTRLHGDNLIKIAFHAATGGHHPDKIHDHLGEKFHLIPKPHHFKTLPEHSQKRYMKEWRALGGSHFDHPFNDNEHSDDDFSDDGFFQSHTKRIPWFYRILP